MHQERAMESRPKLQRFLSGCEAFGWCFLFLMATGCTGGAPVDSRRSSLVRPGSDTIIDGKHHFIPREGIISDSVTAVRVGEAILRSVYGRQQIDRQSPLQARLDDQDWTVEGTLRPGTLGGTALVVLSKRDGRVVRVSHGE
jgi:hypothetical protein